MGAWWPRTRDLFDELPPLVEELRRRGLKVTRVAYNPTLWKPAARRLEADGATIRLGCFRSIDRQSLNLTGDATRGRLDLLVVPPTRPRRSHSAPSPRQPILRIGTHPPRCSTH
jgi:hypothetical protein